MLVKDSVGDTGKKFLVGADLEDDGIKKAHIEKDFITFFSSTPRKNFFMHMNFVRFTVSKRNTIFSIT